MKSAIIRADGNTQIGLGHIMRSLALAQGLQKTDIEPLFITRDYDRKIIDTIHHYKFNVVTIPGNYTRTEDLRFTLSYAGQHRCRLVFTDLGSADTLTRQDEYVEYLRGIKADGLFLVSIDDLNEIAFPSDIVINPNCGAEKKHYPAGDNTRFLLGPDYFIFRQEFIAAAVTKRNIKKKAENVLIVISGTDPLDLTGKVARSLAASDKTYGLNLRFVLGIDYSTAKVSKLEQSLKIYRGTYELPPGNDNMARLMLWADIVITGGGLTKYEAAVTGTPCIIIPQYDFLVKLSEEFTEKGTALNLGLGNNLKDNEIAEAVADLMNNHNLRTEMSKNGKKLVDGKGIERIISKIPLDV